jgi:hypothetical protein
MKVEKLFKNQIYDPSNSAKIQLLKTKFPELQSCAHDQYVSLAKYLEATPEKFYSDDAFKMFYQNLGAFNNQRSSELATYLNDYQNELSRALHLLNEVNRQNWNDILISERGYALTKFIDQTIHPNYLRISEGVFKPIAKIIAYHSRIQRGVSTENLDLYNIVEEFKRIGLHDLIDSLDNTMRNGIAHGGITYLDHDIRYEDKKGNTTQIDAREVIRMFDSLLDVSNGMALALKLFLLADDSGKLKIPRQLLIEEITESTRTGWWEIQGVVDSSIETQKQLLIYVDAKSLETMKIMMSALKTAIMAEQFAPGYDRYFFSFDAPGLMPGCAGMSGKVLKQCRENNVDTIEGYKGLFDKEVFMYIPKWKAPKFVRYLETIYFALKENFRSELPKQNQKWGLPNFEIRDSKIHRNSWGLVLHAAIFLDEKTLDEQFDKIRKFPRFLVFKALKHAKKYESDTRFLKFLPLGWSRVAIYRRNQRSREFGNVGLGKDLICTLGLKRIKRIESPELLGSELEKIAGVTVAWNKAWIDEYLEEIDRRKSVNENI